MRVIATYRGPMYWYQIVESLKGEPREAPRITGWYAKAYSLEKARKYVESGQADRLKANSSASYLLCEDTVWNLIRLKGAPENELGKEEL